MEIPQEDGTLSRLYEVLRDVSVQDLMKRSREGQLGQLRTIMEYVWMFPQAVVAETLGLREVMRDVQDAGLVGLLQGGVSGAVSAGGMAALMSAGRVITALKTNIPILGTRLQHTADHIQITAQTALTFTKQSEPRKST